MLLKWIKAKVVNAQMVSHCCLVLVPHHVADIECSGTAKPWFAFFFHGDRYAVDDIVGCNQSPMRFVYLDSKKLTRTDCNGCLRRGHGVIKDWRMNVNRMTAGRACFPWS